MQVVEVEESDASKQKVDVSVPSEIVKSEEPSSLPFEEKPDIASAFAAPIDAVKDEPSIPPKEIYEPVSPSDVQKDIPPLKTEDKRDIVSELFEPKRETVSYPDISLDKKPSRFGFVIWVIVLFAVVALIGGGLLFFKKQSSSAEIPSADVSPTPTPIVLETETPEVSSPSGSKSSLTTTPSKAASPTAAPKKTGLSIQVLNGSGKSGAATAMKKYLEEKGYNVVGTGNAKNFEYEQTEIVIKSDKSSSLDKLKSDLSGSYTVGSTSATLEASSTFDAQVIIGKE